jgi:hypothetical protein
MRPKLTIIVAILSAGLVQASVKILPGDSDLPRVYISPMIGELDGFIAAEIVKQRLPMRVVLDEKDAQLELTGLSITEQKTPDKHIGNVRLLDLRNGTMIWAGEAGDRSVSFNYFYGVDIVFSDRRRKGLRKIAERIVERMKKESFNGQSAQLISALPRQSQPGTPSAGGKPTQAASRSSKPSTQPMSGVQPHPVSGFRQWLRNDGGDAFRLEKTNQTANN